MSDPVDVVIVGSGINGAIVAALVHARRPDASILVLEAGREITAHDGEHLVEADESAMSASYETLMRRAQQIEYVKGATAMTEIEGDTWNADMPGVFPLAFFGNNFAQFPGASVGWNIGGLGVHWTAACPWAYEDEIPAFLPRGEWDADQETARGLLRVYRGPLVDNPFAEPIFAAIRAAVPADDETREFGHMPMAGVPHTDRPFARTGPRDIAPFLFDGSVPHVRLESGVLATRVLTDGGAVTGIRVRDVATGEETVFAGAQYVLAADSLRTPQLMWASGIRPEALGVRLNEHASLSGDVVIDAARLGLTDDDIPTPPPGEPFIGSYWSPSIGAMRPMHGQLMERDTEEFGHVLGVGWYCATEIRPENRVEFSDELTDALGMPHMTVHFSYSEKDREQIRATRKVQAAAANAVGAFDADSATLLPAGASLHFTGTTRMGAEDDGTTVVDTDGRVWGLDNLYLVGNGVVPTALTCNSTLTGAVLSVRTARAVASAIRA
ncbi:MAG: GMC oxidoreductase [Microbacterium sp.]